MLHPLRLSNLYARTPIRQLSLSREPYNTNTETRAEAEAEPEADPEASPEAGPEAGPGLIIRF